MTKGTFEQRLARREAGWPYGDSCLACAVDNHGGCFGTRWLVSKNTSDYDNAQKYPPDERELLLTGGVCGCAERKHEGARGVRRG